MFAQLQWPQKELSIIYLGNIYALPSALLSLSLRWLIPHNVFINYKLPSSSLFMIFPALPLLCGNKRPFTSEGGVGESFVALRCLLGPAEGEKTCVPPLKMFYCREQLTDCHVWPVLYKAILGEKRRGSAPISC